MIDSNDGHRDRSERFVRCENVARYSQMLASEQNEAERKILTALIGEEKEKQKDAGDNVTNHLQKTLCGAKLPTDSRP